MEINIEESEFFNEEYPDSYYGDLNKKNCELKTVDITKIKLLDKDDEFIFPTDDIVVSHIMNLLYTNIKEGIIEEDKINPLVLYSDLTLEDGYHRYAALKNVGFKTVRAFIYDKNNEPLLKLEDFERDSEDIAKKTARLYSFDDNINWEYLDKVFDNLKNWVIKNNHLEEIDRMNDHYNSYFKDDKTAMNKINFFASIRGFLAYWYYDMAWMSEIEYNAFMLSLC